MLLNTVKRIVGDAFFVAKTYKLQGINGKNAINFIIYYLLSIIYYLEKWKAFMIDWSEHDMRVSRTELKKAHERLQALSIPLASLSKKQLKNLPASDYFMAELMAESKEDLASYIREVAILSQLKM